MEMIAASKMKKAQQQALKGRPYLNKLSEMIAVLITSSEPKLTHKLLEKNNHSNNIAYIIITADRGLCGAFNTNIAKISLENFSVRQDKGRKIVAVGRKIRQTMQRLGQSIVADFEQMANAPEFLDTLGIARIVLDEYLAGSVDEAYLIYNHFYSTINQKPVVQKLLPIEPETIFIAESSANEASGKIDYIFEGEKNILLDELLHRLVNIKVYQAVMESAASEHSARMISMHQASDNAKEIVLNLTLEYNKTRQSKITTQILEIIGAVQ